MLSRVEDWMRLVLAAVFALGCGRGPYVPNDGGGDASLSPSWVTWDLEAVAPNPEQPFHSNVPATCEWIARDGTGEHADLSFAASGEDGISATGTFTLGDDGETTVSVRANIYLHDVSNDFSTLLDDSTPCWAEIPGTWEASGDDLSADVMVYCPESSPLARFHAHLESCPPL